MGLRDHVSKSFVTYPGHNKKFESSRTTCSDYSWTSRITIQTSDSLSINRLFFCHETTCSDPRKTDADRCDQGIFSSMTVEKGGEMEKGYKRASKTGRQYCGWQVVWWIFRKVRFGAKGWWYSRERSRMVLTNAAIITPHQTLEHRSLL